MVLELWVTPPPSSVEPFTSKYFVEFFFFWFLKAGQRSELPHDPESVTEGLELDWKAAYLLSASASVVEGSHNTPFL